jgi:hypothetical protein
MSSSSGIKKDAFATYGQQSAEGQAAEQQLNPIYSNEATNPQGYSPTELAAMQTASAQTLGGGVASAVGQGGLLAARTGNAGGAAAAIDAASQQAGQTNSQNMLNVANQNANLMQKQQQAGISGLNSIYDTGTQAADAALNTANNVRAPFWQTLTNTALGDLSGSYSGGGAAAAGG